MMLQATPQNQKEQTIALRNKAGLSLIAFYMVMLIPCILVYHFPLPYLSPLISLSWALLLWTIYLRIPYEVVRHYEIDFRDSSSYKQPKTPSAMPFFRAIRWGVKVREQLKNIPSLAVEETTKDGSKRNYSIDLTVSNPGVLSGLAWLFTAYLGIYLLKMPATLVNLTSLAMAPIIIFHWHYKGYPANWTEPKQTGKLEILPFRETKGMADLPPTRYTSEIFKEALLIRRLSELFVVILQMPPQRSVELAMSASYPNQDQDGLHQYNQKLKADTENSLQKLPLTVSVLAIPLIPLQLVLIAYVHSTILIKGYIYLWWLAIDAKEREAAARYETPAFEP